MRSLAARAGWHRPPGIVRRALRWLLALHVTVLALAPLLVVTGAVRPHTGRQIAFAVAGGVAIAVLHLRHVAAAVRGGRPAGWRWTLAAQAALAFLPVPSLGADWASTSITLAASAMLLLPRPWGLPVGFGVPFLLSSVAYTYQFAGLVSPWTLVLELVYLAITWPVFSFALYGTVRLVRLVDELYRTRAELATAAVDRERVRVSRDLHDLLGHSLSAISLKGDLAVRLLRRDPAAARAEITGLTELARVARRDVSAVTHGDHQVDLPGEIAATEGLLAAAGVRTRFDVAGLDPGPLPDPVRRVLAWAVREGTTNLLRHSEAETCTIILTRADGTVSLEMTNDGVRQPAPATGSSTGSGLAGLADRARDAGGSVTAASTGDGRFRLRLDLPSS
jgi:two-component system, NarL family, sensor histidine kinase DesK